MNTKELNAVLYADPLVRYGGTRARDQVPRGLVRNLPVSYVFNTDNSESPGSHWVAVYLTESRVEYFDSYGFPPTRLMLGNKLISFLHRQSKRIHFNAERLQSPNTAVCGQYCVLFLQLRSRGCSMKKIVSELTSLRRRDHRVHQWVEAYFK